MSSFSLTRRSGESVWVNDELEIIVTLVHNQGRQVRLTFVGPRERYAIARSEIRKQGQLPGEAPHVRNAVEDRIVSRNSKN